MSNSHFTHHTLTINTKVQLWIETVGQPDHPAILLISGAASQCKLWPDAFCQQLAERGFFVIRYDHRDVGKSSAIDFDSHPYTVMDLTQDALHILDYFQRPSAHIVGFSMGGQIAQFLAAYFPDRAQSITLMATSCSFQEGFDAFSGRASTSGLSQPKPHYVEWAIQVIDFNQQTQADKIQHFLTSWKLLNGDKVPFDHELYLTIAKDCYSRSTLDNPFLNQGRAMLASLTDHSRALKMINTPTLIIHGTEDPVFGIDHGHALHDAIPGAMLAVLEGMGHNMNTQFFTDITNHITKHISRS